MRVVTLWSVIPWRTPVRWPIIWKPDIKLSLWMEHFSRNLASSPVERGKTFTPVANCMKYSEVWITRTAGDHQKSLSYEKFELGVMLSLCFSHDPTIASPLRSSVFHFLAELSKICEIFFSCEKKPMKLSLLHKNVNISSHRKGNLIAVYQFEL